MPCILGLYKNTFSNRNYFNSVFSAKRLRATLLLYYITMPNPLFMPEFSFWTLMKNLKASDIE